MPVLIPGDWFLEEPWLLKCRRAVREGILVNTLMPDICTTSWIYRVHPYPLSPLILPEALGEAGLPLEMGKELLVSPI